VPIRQLDPTVAAKIAAGEVVERPASVVKELVENAIDAGATDISVEIRDGGFAQVRVTDNGSGIAPAELELAFQQHATSKITGLDDLYAVRTLGFRGEALYSIAAVSQVTLVSRQQGAQAASYVEISEGRVTGSGQKGAPAGTGVTVRNLFYNVPARRKFLKSPQLESGRVAVLLTHLALAYPATRISLTSDGERVLGTNGSGSIYDVLVTVMGLETARQMIALGEEADDGRSIYAEEVAHGASTGVSVRGYISQPHLNRATRTDLTFFVNRRWVQSPLMMRAVEQAYHTLLPVGRHPMAVLDVSVPLQEVDVNVHPAKSEVKLQKEGEVFLAVQKAVRAALVASATIPVVAAPFGQAPAGQVAQMPGHTALPWRPVTAASSAAAVDLFRPAEAVGMVSVRTLPPLRILGQMAQTYIIAEAPDGMYLIDQHTAHERVLYDRLMTEHARLSVKSQMLLDPLTLELTPRQLAILQPKVPSLCEMGFGLEAFGERAYLVRSIPAVLQGHDALQALLEILDLLADDKGSPPNWHEALYITIACHGAVRAGTRLTEEEMRQLIAQLEETELPRTCPHGRPTLLHISQVQLEREFGRR
jgi:DNA mismatch repair protein MutL